MSNLTPFELSAHTHTLSVTATPELLSRLQCDIHKLLAAYERNSGRADIKRAASLAASTVTISRKGA